MLVHGKTLPNLASGHTRAPKHVQHSGISTLSRAVVGEF